MTLQQIKYVSAINRYGSFNEAAKNLFVSQSSLSSAIKDLEGELGVPLFIRTGKGVELSAEGQDFISYAHQLIELVDLIEERYSGQMSSPPARLSISSHHYSFVEYAFIEMLRELNLSRYDLGLRETKTLGIIEDVATLHSEVGIFYIGQNNEKLIRKQLRANRLEFHPILDVNPCIFVRKNHPLARKKEISLEELKPYPFIFYEQEKGPPLVLGEEVPLPFRPERTLHAFDRCTVLNVIRRTDAYNLGTGLLSPDMRDNLTTVPIKGQPPMTIGWIKHRDVISSDLARRFIEKVTACAAEYADK